jgi:hypothetical protein
MRGRRGVVVVVGVLIAGAVGGVGGPGGSAGVVGLGIGSANAAVGAAARQVPARPFDFNGDGYEDLAVGVPGEDVGRVVDAGAVQVINGSRKGLRAAGDQWWSLNTRGVPGRAREGDRLGSALTSGDFNRDGYADLAAAVGRDAALRVLVLRGSRTGLRTAGAQLLTTGAPASEDCEAWLAAAGDFNGDGYADQGIGLYCWDQDPREAAHFLAGGRRGLRPTSWALQVPDMVPSGVAADFDGDGITDLLATNPDLTDLAVVAFGSRSAPFYQSTPLFGPGDMEFEEWGSPAFPWTASDVDGDGRAEAVGVMQLWDDDLDEYSAGWVEVTEISREAPPATVVVEHADLGIPSSLGATKVTGGDVTGDGVGDLVIGLAGIEDRPEPYGAVAVVRGTKGAGIVAQQAQILSQATPGVVGTDEPGDKFGAALRIGRYGPGKSAAVAVGAPGEDNGRGRVTVLRGTSTGLSTRGEQTWSQNTKGINDRAEPGDRFGSDLGGPRLN